MHVLDQYYRPSLTCHSEPLLKVIEENRAKDNKEPVHTFVLTLFSRENVLDHWAKHFLPPGVKYRAQKIQLPHMMLTFHKMPLITHILVDMGTDSIYRHWREYWCKGQARPMHSCSSKIRCSCCSSTRTFSCSRLPCSICTSSVRMVCHSRRARPDLKNIWSEGMYLSCLSDPSV